MILWIFAIGLMAVSALIGYYQGALRVGGSLVGLLVAALLAMPLAGLVRPLLPIFGLNHPVVIAFVAPVVVYLVILIAFKSAAVVLHKKVENLYKYKRSDTERSLFDRMNARVGICLGLVNATVYVFLVATVAYVFGYFTFQVAASEKDSFLVRQLNSIVLNMEKTGLSKAVSPFVPKAAIYYDGADVIGHVYHNPLQSQSRLSSYPAFLALAEKPEFKSLGTDVKFQQFWLEGRSLGELVSNDKVQPLVESIDVYTNVMGLLKWDFKDLKGYLENGSSALYDQQRILGRWYYDFKESLARARRGNPNMTLQELRRTRFTLGKMADASLLATIDNRASLKMPLLTNELQNVLGTWKDAGESKYALNLGTKEKRIDLQASVESGRLILSKDGYALVFQK